MKYKQIYPVIVRKDSKGYHLNPNEYYQNPEINKFLEQDKKTITVLKIIESFHENTVSFYYEDIKSTNGSVLQVTDRFSDLGVDHED